MSSIGNVMPVPQQQFCDTNGVPYALGSLTFYAAGTTTPLDTYFNADLASNHKNSNPLTLDAAGRALVYWQPKAYRVILKDANGVQIYDQDTVYGIDINVLLGNQTANTVFAGPSTGSPAAPAFRALVAADLPITQGAMTLLHQGSGTDTNTAATNLDTYALASQLTVKDTLFIVYELEQVTQSASAAHQLYNSTDSVSVGSTFGASTMSSGQQGMGRCWISPLQSSSKAVGQVGQSVRFGVGASNDSNLATFTTDWTGAWTLALRSGGQTSGGTIKWKWAVYRVAGQ